MRILRILPVLKRRKSWVDSIGAIDCIVKICGQL